jgi:protein tyrosine phosphatase (PTP) superfamily phosphohydrolase (DUF442 family)
MIRRRRVLALGASATGLSLVAGSVARDELLEKRVRVVVAGKIIRGAWQRPLPLRRLISRESLRTIVSLTAINRDDPKYVDQREVIDATGVDWIIVPMHGSTATVDQLVEAVDLISDPTRQPVFFHCVGGHHRSNLVQAAYRIRHEGWSLEQAWDEILTLPWTDASADQDDLELVRRFARIDAESAVGRLQS